MVLYSHFFPPDPIHDALNWGYVGVRLFFVLSGFLITGILLDARETGARPGGILRNFYVRRMLRIFPIYYLCLVILIVVRHRTLEPLEIASYLTYTSNWYICWQGGEHLAAGHFWSLAVEEQFYLVWPCLILFLPKRWLLPMILAAIGLAPALRMVLALQKYSVITITFNTFVCLDTLGAGALLAYLWRQPDGAALARRLARWSCLAAIPLAVVAFPQKLWPTHYVILFALQDIFWAALSVALVAYAALGIPGTLGRVLGGGPVAYFGRISYGVYVYHGFAPALAPWLLEIIGIPFPPEGYGRAGLLTALSVACAILSWHILEVPINRLKNWFPYNGGKDDLRAIVPSVK